MIAPQSAILIITIQHERRVLLLQSTEIDVPRHHTLGTNFNIPTRQTNVSSPQRHDETLWTQVTIAGHHASIGLETYERLPRDNITGSVVGIRCRVIAHT